MMLLLSGRVYKRKVHQVRCDAMSNQKAELCLKQFTVCGQHNPHTNHAINCFMS